MHSSIRFIPQYITTVELLTKKAHVPFRFKKDVHKMQFILNYIYVYNSTSSTPVRLSSLEAVSLSRQCSPSRKSAYSSIRKVDDEGGLNHSQNLPS